MTDSAQSADETEHEYVTGVRTEKEALGAYFSRQIFRYRITRSVVIVGAALVPVLASVSSVPRWVLGALGSLVAVTEGMQSLFQYRKSALDAMRTANALERVLNRYMTAVPPFDGPQDEAFTRFVDRIEELRAEADEAFLRTWQTASVASERAPTARSADEA